MLEFSCKLEGIEAALKKFDPDMVMKAAEKALNDASSQALTETSRIIREEYNIKLKDVRKYLRLQRASFRSLEAIITGKGKGIPLYAFSARQEGVIANKKGFRYTRKANRGQGRFRYGGAVTVQVKTSGGRKPVSATPPAFVARFKSGHLGVYQRAGSARLPLKPLYGPGIALLFGTKRIQAAATRKINEVFSPRFSYWLTRYQSGS
jgi:hypothetical protein